MDLPVFNVPERLTLSNGIPVHVLRSTCQPAVRMDVLIDGGQAAQDKLLQALFTNRLLREGTAHLSSSAIAERLDELGSWMELSVSMGSSFLTLHALRRCVRPSCELLRDLLLEPLFPDDQLAIVRDNNRNQFLVNSRRGDVMARRLLNASIYGEDHPCGRFAELPDFDAITREDLLRFYRAHYTSDNVTLYLAGDVDDEVLALVEECFGTWEHPVQLANRVKTVCPTAALRPGQPDPIVCHLPTQAQASIRIGCLMMDAGTEDYYRMRVVSNLLGGFFGSRLMKRIREELGYTYGITSDLITNTRQVLFVINCEAMTDKAEEVRAEVCREMERLCTELVPEEELTMTRNYMLGEVCRNYEGPFSLIDAYIYIHTMGLPEEHLSRTVSTAFHIDQEQLRDAARRWLRPEDMHTVMILP